MQLIAFSGQFQALGREHELSFGINGYKVNANDPAYKVWQFSSRPIQNYHGDVGDYINLTPIGRTITDEYQIGGFASAKLQLADPVKLILGSRLSTWERKNTGTEQKQSNIYTPYVGLILDMNDQISAYASYTSIFNPSTRKNVTGQFLDPEEGNSAEIGLKAEFFNQRLNTSLAYFETKQDNFAVRDGEKFTTDGDFAYIAVNGAKVKGVELSIAGELSPDWHISAGYTYTDAKDRDGKTLTTATGSSLPRQTLKLFTNYQWDKLTLGAGVNWQSEIFDTRARGIATQFNRQDDYVLLNLMGRYQINPDLSLAVNVDNVGNTVYKRTAINTWGELRNFMATLNYKF
ncbi:TonB-dependent receptor [Acinetobacter sp. NIPH 1869]|uniref:TonB-dependent siderophore receptor n=1 Tax=Acinetobacter higginsii TaxID=70347 RepID=UPI001F4ACCAF|nr:TonB-dependent receptor [Acinetobacter higginsii]MCH7305382.1 TonB-dependent receptor [Acinetobacter higginsii]